jgi:hypothetical protein
LIYAQGMSDIINVVTSTPEPVLDATELSDEHFLEKLLAELHSKNVWRKLESLATALSVDVQSLRAYLDSCPGVLRRSGKEDGVFFYCWEARSKQEAKSEKTTKKDKQRPAIREEDRYALAMMHMIYWNFHKVMKTYALEMSQADTDAFNYFALSLDKLEAGLVLYSNKTGATVEKLPKF